mmetsp:Transcript_23080/g.49123  ORF Transcript_23080/g.49123 Transcript_23080/m.49123 type:complete len:82 (+) Transcript_23080:558-803(+)
MPGMRLSKVRLMVLGLGPEVAAAAAGSGAAAPAAAAGRHVEELVVRKFSAPKLPGQGISVLDRAGSRSAAAAAAAGAAQDP